MFFSCSVVKINVFRESPFIYLCVMKLFRLSLLFLIPLTFLSCEEEPPFIDFSPPYKTKDTTYINLTIPPAQNKAVLIEDITGVRCVNCPDAAKKARDIVTAKTEDSVVVIA